MSDPHEKATIGVAIKVPESKRYAGDSPWFTPNGSVAAVREMILEAFGIDDEGQTLFDLTMQAQGLANSVSRNPDVGLGAKVLGKPAGKAAEKPQESAEAPAKEAPAQEAEDPILAALKAATTLDEVKTIRAENQQAFADNADYLAAWKARGRAIKNGDA